MPNQQRSPHHLPDPGAPPPRNPSRLARYLATQWRRVFGLNITEIDPLLYCGGEFSVAQWPRLHARGIRAVLSLQAEREDQFADPQPARALRLLVEDFHPPSVDQLREAVAFLEKNHDEGLPTLVHCHAGVGRAPLTMAAFLVSRGKTAAEAMRQISDARPIVRLNRRQQHRLDEWERLVRDGR